MYREQALEYHRTPRPEGSLLRIAPRWTEAGYALLLWALLSALLFGALGTVHEYASGPAIVRVASGTDLTAPTAATVARVHVMPGQRVREGQTLFEFYRAGERAELARVESVSHDLTLRMLLDPGDQAARNELGALAAQRTLAKAALAARTVVAPHDGVVSDVRVRQGQALEAGTALATVMQTERGGRVVMLAPAHHRPMLHPGMNMRLQLAGFPFAYQNVQVEIVGSEAIGPAEVERYLGPRDADTVLVHGPVVIVEGRLTRPDFVAGGDRYAFYDGMGGEADVRLRTEAIWVALIPGLKEVLHRAFWTERGHS